jgi:hypothetical protein
MRHARSVHHAGRRHLLPRWLAAGRYGDPGRSVDDAETRTDAGTCTANSSDVRWMRHARSVHRAGPRHLLQRRLASARYGGSGAHAIGPTAYADVDGDDAAGDAIRLPHAEPLRNEPRTYWRVLQRRVVLSTTTDRNRSLDQWQVDDRRQQWDDLSAHGHTCRIASTQRSVGRICGCAARHPAWRDAHQSCDDLGALTSASGRVI